MRVHAAVSAGQALEKVDGQAAWRVRHLLALAQCQASPEGRPEEVLKTLAKALELATAANLQPLRVGASTLPFRSTQQQQCSRPTATCVLQELQVVICVQITEMLRHHCFVAVC